MSGGEIAVWCSVPSELPFWIVFSNALVLFPFYHSASLRVYQKDLAGFAWSLNKSQQALSISGFHHPRSGSQLMENCQQSFGRQSTAGDDASSVSPFFILYHLPCTFVSHSRLGRLNTPLLSSTLLHMLATYGTWRPSPVLLIAHLVLQMILQSQVFVYKMDDAWWNRIDRMSFQPTRATFTLLWFWFLSGVLS